MSKKFIVALHGTPHFRDPITQYLLAKDWRVWHWYADLWLVSDVPDGEAAGSIYQGVKDSIPTITSACLLILDTNSEHHYYGTAPKAEAWIWMKEHWGVPNRPPIEQAGAPIPEVEKLDVQE
jgi:hypothetical protein